MDGAERQMPYELITLCSHQADGFRIRRLAEQIGGELPQSAELSASGNVSR